MTRSDTVETLLIQAYQLVSQCQLQPAAEQFEKALQLDFDHPELLLALKCEAWWQDSLLKATKRPEPFDAGEFLLGQWKAFRLFLAGQQDHKERTSLAFKQMAFGKALEYFQQLLQEGETADPDVSYKIGCCHKGIGNYESAVQFIEEANRQRKDDPCFLAELADIYALVNETRASKALFREAFFINPQRIDLELLESGVIARLQEKILENGKTGHETVEWVPVYAEVGGVFSVKRELKPIEVSRLKNNIYELETELNNDGSRRAVLVPRLINKYFWLIDHYIDAKEEKAKIDEVLLKIKLLDAAIYKLYIA